MKNSGNLLESFDEISRESDPLDCAFCDIKTNWKERIIEESPRTFSFYDRNSGRCKVHILICPKKHIKNYNFLNSSDLEMLLEMRQEAHRMGSKYGDGSPYRMGFHIPPFYSIKHLHLHLCIEPIHTCWSKAVTFGLNLKPLDQVIEKLEKLYPKLTIFALS